MGIRSQRERKSKSRRNRGAKARKCEIKSPYAHHFGAKENLKIELMFSINHFHQIIAVVSSLCLQLLFKKTIRISKLCQTSSQHQWPDLERLLLNIMHGYRLRHTHTHTVLSIIDDTMLMTLEWRLLVVWFKWSLLYVDRTKINTISVALRPCLSCRRRVWCVKRNQKFRQTQTSHKHSDICSQKLRLLNGMPVVSSL